MPRKHRTKKKEEIIEDNKIRIPRPLGLTYLNSQYLIETDQTKKLKLKEDIINHIIQIYINDNYTFQGKQTSIEELAQYLNIQGTQLLRSMNRQIERITNFFDDKEGKAFARGLYINSVKKGLEIQAMVARQTAILMAQQGDNYVPFLTSEVNRSMANLINAQKPIADLIKMLGEKNAINILINMDKQSETSGVHYLSPEQAIEIIKKEGPSMYQNIPMLEQKMAEFESKGGLPDVTARNQDLSSIGVRIPSLNKSGNEPNPIPNEVLNAEDFIA